MGLQQGFTNNVRLYKKQMEMSLTEFSEMLDISRTSAQDYIKGKGNPTLATVEHFAEKLNVDPVRLLSDDGSLDKNEKLMLMFKNLEPVLNLPPEKRQIFIEHFLEIMKLFD